MFVQRIKRYPVKTRTRAWLDYKEYRTVHWILGVLASLGFLVNPAVGFSLLVAILVYFVVKIYTEYLEEPRRTLYERLLRPIATPKHFVQIGYEVPYEEPFFTAHLNALEKGGEELKRKEMEAKREPHRIIGFSKSLLGQHFLVVGTTGAGKTSLIMTLLKVVMGLGGGAVFVDGKGDTEMLFKCYRIAEKQGRTVDFFVISFIEPEKVGSDTNTINPLATLSAAGQVTFFMEVATASAGGAAGDKAYWLGRGKVLFQPVIIFNYMRKKFYREPYSLETLSQYLSAEMYSELSAMATALAVALDKRIENSTKLAGLRNEARKRHTPTTKVPTLEAVLNYLMQFPYRQTELRKIGIEFSFADLVYKSFNLSTAFIKSLDQQWMNAVIEAGEKIYEVATSEGKDVLSLPILSLRQYLQKVKGSRTFVSRVKNQKMLEQYGYAQQQWDEVLQSLSVFSNVFGAADPDVDPVDIVKNARILYALLPSLSSDEKTRNMLGNIIVNTVRGAMALSLGGKLDNLTATMARIVTNSIKPEPIGLLILDEYGSYPVPGINDILAQARSLKWSVLIAVQDLTSLRVGGTNEHSLRRNWANTVNKFIMKNLDKETLEFLSATLPKGEILTESSFEDADEIAPQGVLNVVKEAFINPERMVEYKNGFGILLSDGKLSLMQTFWADEKSPEKVQFNRFRKIL